jgi:2-polyprenyl-6-methoxyphenol hydroxylase-like FAD-dependent oxidoreductase
LCSKPASLAIPLGVPIISFGRKQMNSQARRALVIGGSMSGLFSALYLRQHGWGVEVYERSPVPLTGRGAGIMTHPELRAALADLGLDTARNFGVPVEGRLVLDGGGNIVARKAWPQIATSWNRLFEMLMGAIEPERYHLGKDLERVSQSGGIVSAHFTDGSSLSADLLVGADGFRSAVRSQLLPEAQPKYAGYVAWRGLADECVVTPVLTQEIFERLSFCLPPGEQFLGYRVAGPGNDLRVGHRSWNVVWYRPAEAPHEVERLLTDDTGKLHEVSIPPPLVSRAVVGEMRDAAERLLPPQFRAALRLIEQPFLQPIYDLESPQMAFGRVALVGDAAFVIRPHVGGGIAKAAQDAAALASALDEHATVEAGLRAYQTLRLKVGRRYVAQARRLGSYLKYRFESEEERARAAFHARPEQVLADTASLEFMRAPI